MPDRERKRVPDHRSDVLKGSLPQGPPTHPSSLNLDTYKGQTRVKSESSSEVNGKNVIHCSCYIQGSH